MTEKRMVNHSIKVFLSSLFAKEEAVHRSASVKHEGLVNETTSELKKIIIPDVVFQSSH